MNPLPAVFATLRFANVQYPWLWVLLLALGAGVLIGAYRGIFQRTERGLTWWLLGLRAAGLLLLVLILANPTWTRESELVDPGHVLVILDNSRSMSLPDASGSTRYARARAAAEDLGKALASHRGGPRVVVDLFDVNGAPLKEAPEKPTAERTDLGRALREAGAQMRSRPVAGLVLISDGMDNTGRPDFRDWEDTSVPIHGLGYPAPDGTDLDLAVRKPQAPERTLVHNEVRVEVPVSKTGTPASEATVSVKRGREVLASQNVSFGAGQAEKVVSLTFTPHQPGTFVFTAAVEGEAGERNLGNNLAHFRMRVDAEPIKVLYVEGYLRNEYKYLKARLEDDPDIGLVSVIRRGSPDLPDAKANKDLFTEEQLKNIDVVILGDLEAGYLSVPQYQQLVRWLDGKNHSLLVLGGYHSFGPEGLRTTPLADTLPVVFATNPPYQSEEPFQLRLADKGQGHAIFTLSNDRAKDTASWNEAPPLQGMCLVQRVKPGAEELAVNPRVQIEGKPAVVMAAQRAGGGGQIAVFAADTTWYWSRVPRVLGQSDTLYARFWSQAMRWLAGRGIDDQRPLLAVSTDQPDYDVGKKVKISVLKQPRPDTDLSRAQVTVEVTTPGGEVKPLQRLKDDSTNPDLVTGVFEPAAGGRYEVTASLSVDGKSLGNQAAEFLVQGADLELANTGTNPANLEALARATGGVYLDIDRARELPDKIARKERRTVKEIRTEYWDSPWLFLGFLGAVSGEWFLRRRNHLV